MSNGMIIGGLQKTTLLDYPEKIAATVFLEGCNFRCPFCHNAILVTERDKENEIEEKSFFEFLEKRQGVLDGVCVTGGEPLINPYIFDFIAKIKKMGFLVKVDTNGSFPQKLKYLVSKKLVDYVAMDIKNCKEKYAETAGVKNFCIKPIEDSVDILKAGTVDYEFRTTLVREFHKLDDMEKIGKWLKGAKSYRLQAFVDSGNLIGKNLSGFSKEETVQFKKIAKKFIDDVEIRGF